MGNGQKVKGGRVMWSESVLIILYSLIALLVLIALLLLDSVNYKKEGELYDTTIRSTKKNV